MCHQPCHWFSEGFFGGGASWASRYLFLAVNKMRLALFNFPAALYQHYHCFPLREDADMWYCSPWISIALYWMHRLSEDGERRVVITEFTVLCDGSAPDTSCRNCWCCVLAVHHDGRNSPLPFFPGRGTQGHLTFPSPLELAFVARCSRMGFFPLFSETATEKAVVHRASLRNCK